MSLFESEFGNGNDVPSLRAAGRGTFPDLLTATPEAYQRRKHHLLTTQGDCRVGQSFRGPSLGASGAAAGSVGVCVWSD